MGWSMVWETSSLWFSEMKVGDFGDVNLAGVVLGKGRKDSLCLVTRSRLARPAQLCRCRRVSTMNG